MPGFVLVYFSGFTHAKTLCVLIYAIATFTDFLDGYIARKYDLITNLGKVLDPLGDKMFTFAVLSCITIEGIIPVWILLLLFAKEAIMGLGGIVLHRRGQVEIPPANILGKTATVLFFVVCVVLLLFELSRDMSVGLMCLALSMSFAALVSYIVKFMSIMRKRKDS